MNDCRTIERLLYLWREGELTESEKAHVREHAAHCPACTAVLAGLQRIDHSLAPERASAPVLSRPDALVASTLREIDRRANGAAAVRGGIPDILLAWLKPSLGFALLAAVAVLVLQTSRDAVKISALENRLNVMGGQAAGLRADENTGLLEDVVKSNLPVGAVNAGILPDPAELVRNGFTGLFGGNKTFADELRRKYPHLASMSIGDTLDERGREVLATEGRAFLKEFEQILREGVKRP